MITIAGQLCYSPLPPSSYGKSPVGHGPYCGDDIQLWNLMYLSYPQLDAYLEPGADAIQVMRSMPMIVVGGPRAALNGEANRELFPYLRDALKQTPSMFLQHLWTMQWPLLPMALHDENWIDTLIARAKQVEDEDGKSRAGLVISSSGNVTAVQFGGEVGRFGYH